MRRKAGGGTPPYVSSSSCPESREGKLTYLLATNRQRSKSPRGCDGKVRHAWSESEWVAVAAEVVGWGVGVCGGAEEAGERFGEEDEEGLGLEGPAGRRCLLIAYSVFLFLRPSLRWGVLVDFVVRGLGSSCHRT